MKKEIPFDKLSTADLIIDAIYKGGSSGGTGGALLPKKRDK